MRFPTAFAAPVSALVLALAVSGCATEAGPTAKGPTADPGVDALRTKVRALSADECFGAPGVSSPRGCQKYVTELAGTAGSVRKLGRTDPVLTEQADALDTAITRYRAGGTCATQQAPGGTCTGALTAIAAALGIVGTHLDSTAPAG